MFRRSGKETGQCIFLPLQRVFLKTLYSLQISDHELHPLYKYPPKGPVSPIFPTEKNEEFVSVYSYKDIQVLSSVFEIFSVMEKLVADFSHTNQICFPIS